MPKESDQTLADTYQGIVNLLKARLANDGTPEVLSEEAREELEDWQDVFQIKVAEQPNAVELE